MEGEARKTWGTYRLAIFIREVTWEIILLELEMNVKWDGRDDNTQGHSVGPLRVGSLDRYRNSSLSLRIIDILIQLQADVLQPRFSQLISAI